MNANTEEAPVIISDLNRTWRIHHHGRADSVNQNMLQHSRASMEKTTLLTLMLWLMNT